MDAAPQAPEPTIRLKSLRTWLKRRAASLHDAWAVEGSPYLERKFVSSSRLSVFRESEEHAPEELHEPRVALQRPRLLGGVPSTASASMAKTSCARAPRTMVGAPPTYEYRYAPQESVTWWVP